MMTVTQTLYTLALPEYVKFRSRKTKSELVISLNGITVSSDYMRLN